MAAAQRRNGRALTRADLKEAIDDNAKLFSQSFASLKESFTDYKETHDKWGQERILEIYRRLDAVEEEVRDELKAIRARLDQESSTRKTVAAIAAAIGGLVGAVVTWVIALFSGKP